MSTPTAAGLVLWAESRLGQGYIYGGYFDRVITEAYLQQKAAQYPGQYTEKYLERSRKWIDEEAGDCVGLIKSYYWFDGSRVVYNYQGRVDTNARGLFNRATVKGPIDTMPDRPGTGLYFPSSTMCHVGVYVGGGDAIESRGVDYGVVRTKVKDRPWTHWFEIPYLDYAGGEPMRRLLKRTVPNMRGEDVKEFQEAANKLINAGLKLDGTFGPASEQAAKDLQMFFSLKADGIVGPDTWAAIDAALEEPAPAPDCTEHIATIAKLEEEVSTLKTQVVTLNNSNKALQAELFDALEYKEKVKGAIDILRNA